jgi:ribosome-associated toxin RatA of RatAB toxin-antitoxin module
VSHHAEHAVTAHAPLDLVWEILVDVEGYARIFPPTREVNLLEDSATHQLARLHVDVAGEVQSWVSRRDIDPDRHVIAYRQLETAPIVGRMGGEWRAFRLDDDHTQLVLTHDFAAAKPVDGKVAGRFSFEEADTMLQAVVERNSVADLNAVKAEAERRADRTAVA